ncbi:MAG: glycosyl transferase family 2 [Bryobacterales bacterium]|nr:glycosyl transferase family 2 [Bryobacterales bacterium]
MIVTWRCLADVRKCLASIYRHTGDVDFEVLVVDNASGDDSEAQIASDFPQVRFIQSGANVGFARANNIGFAHSKGDLILFLNPDTELESNVLSEVLRYMNRHELVGAAGVRLLNSDGSLQDSCVQAYPTIVNQVLDSAFLRKTFPRSFLWGNRILTDPNGNRDVEAVSGAFFITRREVCAKVGGFTESYFMYGEDLDLSYKVRATGFALHCIHECAVIHHGGRSSSSRGRFFAHLRQRESIRQFLELRRGRFYARGYRFAMAAAACIRLALLFAGRINAKASSGAAIQETRERWKAILVWALRGRLEESWRVTQS